MTGCYRCGRRLYFSARQRGLGLCHPCEVGLDYASMDPHKAIGANLRAVSWSPYYAPSREPTSEDGWVSYTRNPIRMESIRG